MVLDSRGVQVSERDRERIRGCTELATLEVWIQRAAFVDSAEELFA